jgi:Tfp pilus assembly protein PilN
MLRTNLSTRPFYNERAVHGLLTMAGVLVLVLTLFNVFEIVVLTGKQSELGSKAAAAETRARELRAHAAQTRQGIDTKKLETISGAAREANTIIGQRLFSWTELLNELETTLPEEVRITSMHPRVEPEGIIIQLTVVARRAQDINQFLGNLEATHAFTDMLSRNEVLSEDGLQATVEGRYVPPAGSATGTR